MLRAYQSPCSGWHWADQWAQRPNLASRNQSGVLYCLRESQVGLKGPSARMRGALRASVISGLGGGEGGLAAEVAGAAGEVWARALGNMIAAGTALMSLTAVRRDIFMWVPPIGWRTGFGIGT